MKTEAGEAVTLEDIMVFFSGESNEPPLGFVPKPTITFVEGQFATANVCYLILRIPLENLNYPLFKRYMTLSLKGHGGFGTV